MTFAVTTKSGRSELIKASSYKEAEKIALRRFGAGCIVDLVKNALSRNPVVNSALKAARNHV